MSHNINMQPGLLPLFPLPVVLFPRTPLPLHIFEDRYKEMIGDVLPDRSEFGVVLARENGILNAGCTAVVVEVLAQHPDGRMDILTVGRRRFEILELNDEKSYLRGAVEFFDDDEPAERPAGDVRERAIEACRVLREIEGSGAEPELEDPQLSFQLAQVIEDVDFRQSLLRIRSEAERLRQFVRFCDTYIPRQRMIAGLRRVQPLNGHSRLRFPGSK
ncbi:MAG TPA: LON peptidase substrate-binding domain-containing protein [Bryobacteraceae bacterium]|nr:LON peptidase substrate-binding domain-containing protein [Bryobacteraceae bacterium]HOL70968.1 LON peptidase substrate-binding domain-containing protein [Bryobacteraceae bacterium]HOQ44744.1 LON peptidase substrate-binding domain-containing protein [Bryobacteraceae bacterium]